MEQAMVCCEIRLGMRPHEDTRFVASGQRTQVPHDAYGAEEGQMPTIGESLF
jgi:hypothetical protein